MIRIDRDKIERAKVALLDCINSSRTASNLKIKPTNPDDDDLEKAIMLALTSLAMDVFGSPECVTASDVHHLVSKSDFLEKQVP